MPSTLKGAFTTGLQAITGNSPSVLIDKLGQRLAFERSGVRLYDALITKCKSAEPVLDISLLEQFRNDEAEHFVLVKDCIVSIGGDPTAQTPCAYSSGVAAMGIMQVLNDPRSSIPQYVDAILMPELADASAWQLLVEPANEAGLDDYVDKFQQASLTEDHHMQTIKDWLQRLTMENELKAVGLLPFETSGINLPAQLRYEKRVIS